MKLREFIDRHENELLDFPEMPAREDYEYYRMIPCCNDPTDFHEEFGFNGQAYDEDMDRWEYECDKVRDEYVFCDSDLCLIDAAGNEITDWNEIRKLLECEVVRTDGFDVWVA